LIATGRSGRDSTPADYRTRRNQQSAVIADTVGAVGTADTIGALK